MKIINYKHDYIEDVLRCWNSTLQYDLITKERFIETVLLDDNFQDDLMKLAIIDNHCVGFCYGVKRKFPYLERGLEPERGWISIMAVCEEYQRQGIGTKLVEEVEKALKEKGTSQMTLCAYSPNYFTPGIDERYRKAIDFFTKMGYNNTSEAVSMQRDLWDYVIPEKTQKKIKDLSQEGIHFIPYQEKYLCNLLDFLLDNFGSGWKRNALMAMQKKEAEQTIILCVDQDDQIIGFVMRKIDGNDARFGPIGVKEELRSKGLGGVLLDLMMQDLKARNIHYLYFLWTSGAAQRFYDRHGFKVFRTYQLYRKEI